MSGAHVGEVSMNTKKKELPFDPDAFLSISDAGKTIVKYAKNQIIFQQGGVRHG